MEYANIPILPISILDFCKQKLLAPPMVHMYFIAQQPGPSIKLEHDAILWDIAQQADQVMKTGHDAILWFIVQHPGLIIELGDDAIQWIMFVETVSQIWTRTKTRTRKGNSEN